MTGAAADLEADKAPKGAVAPAAARSPLAKSAKVKKEAADMGTGVAVTMAAEPASVVLPPWMRTNSAK